jgi:hypothetical protein
MEITRRKIMTVAPGIIALPVLSAIVPKLAAQVGEPTAQLSALANSVSPTVLNAVQSSLVTFASQFQSGTLTAGTSSNFAQAVSIYVGNLAETGWNKAVDQYLIANQSSFVNGSLTVAQAQAVVTQGTNLGIRNLTTSMIIQQSFLAVDEKQAFLSQIETSGTAVLFKTAASALESISSSHTASIAGLGAASPNIVPLDPPQPGGYQPPSKSGSCRGLAALILISALFGAEIPALVGAFGFQAYC